jgi:hypothetical protein
VKQKLDSKEVFKNKRMWLLQDRILPVMMSDATKNVIQVNNQDVLNQPFAYFGQISAHILHPIEDETNKNFYKPEKDF